MILRLANVMRYIIPRALCLCDAANDSPKRFYVTSRTKFRFAGRSSYGRRLEHAYLCWEWSLSISLAEFDPARPRGIPAGTLPCSDAFQRDAKANLSLYITKKTAEDLSGYRTIFGARLVLHLHHRWNTIKDDPANTPAR